MPAAPEIREAIRAGSWIRKMFEEGAALKALLGAENVFDEYPDPFPVNRNTTGNAPFTNYSPFGRSGRFVYGRVSIGF